MDRFRSILRIARSYSNFASPDEGPIHQERGIENEGTSPVHQPPVLVERGEDDSILIIVFTGGAQRLMLPAYEFLETTEILGYSRILLRDPYHKRYHRGIDRQRRSFRRLVAYLQDEIARLNPNKVVCVGTSSGGYAAIRAGHRLRADYVHAFAPQTGARSTIRSKPRGRYRFWPWRSALIRRAGAPVDLRRILRKSNGKTTYYIHYGRGHTKDRFHAEHISGLPGVVTLGYPCETHRIAVFLAKTGFLKESLVLASQDRLPALARERFPKSLEINAPRRDPAGGCCG